MDEKPKNEQVNILSDEELYKSINTQDKYLASLSHKELEEYKRQNSNYFLTNGNISLEYFGAHHIFDPKHEQFQKIAHAFSGFMEGRDISQVVVFVEGAIPATRPNIEEDIHSTGERGFITHIAKEKNIEVRCVEPDIIVEIQYLLEKYTADQIECYYYLRAIRDYFRSGRIQDDTTFEEYSEHLLAKHKQMFGQLNEFANYDFSMESITTTYKEVIGLTFDQNNRLDLNPRKTTTVINKISKACSTFRDFYHVKSIEAALLEGKDVFVVNGEDHAVVQQSALKEMFA